MSKSGPRELDINLTQMRADKMEQIRALIRDLDDLDAVERVLNGHTHQIAVHASVMIESNGGNGKGHRGLIEAAQDRVDHKPPKKRPYVRFKKRSEYTKSDAVMEQIVKVLAEKPDTPLQARSITNAIAEMYPPPYCADSTFNRALKLLREAKRIRMEEGHGKYPHYRLLTPRVSESKPAASSRAAKAVAKAAPVTQRLIKRRRKRTGGKGRGGDPQGVIAGVMRVLADHPDGLQIPEITAIIEAEGSTQFLDGYTHNTQVSWALKGQREKGRVVTIELPEGKRLHKAVRPQITVTKEQES